MPVPYMVYYITKIGGKCMSLVYTEITLKNAEDLMAVRRGYIKETEVRQITVQAMVDTGAWTLVINEETRIKLGLNVTGKEPGTLADGSRTLYDMAGPIDLIWKDRRVLLEAIVVPGANVILLGAIPLEAMDLIVNPKRELVVAQGDQSMHRL